MNNFYIISYISDWHVGHDSEVSRHLSEIPESFMRWIFLQYSN